MQRIVTFGELLLRFSKPGQLRLTQGDMFTSKYGGSEANVAVSLATQGEDVTYITRLPDTPVGHAGAQCMAQLGVDISRIVYGGQRIGTYYFEPAAGMRAAKVVYDRDHSAYYDLAPGMIPWRDILKDADIFQVSGITAAISQQAADASKYLEPIQPIIDRWETFNKTIDQLYSQTESQCKEIYKKYAGQLSKATGKDRNKTLIKYYSEIAPLMRTAVQQALKIRLNEQLPVAEEIEQQMAPIRAQHQDIISALLNYPQLTVSQYFTEPARLLDIPEYGE